MSAVTPHQDLRYYIGPLLTRDDKNFLYHIFTTPCLEVSDRDWRCRERCKEEWARVSHVFTWFLLFPNPKWSLSWCCGLLDKWCISFFPWVAPYRTHNFFTWDPWVLCSQLAGSCTDSHTDCRDHLFTSLQYAWQSSVPFQAQRPYKVVSGSEISSLGLAVCLQQVCNTLALDMSNRWHQNALKWCRVTCQSLQKLTAPLKWVILRSCCFSCTQQVCVIK